MNRLSVAVLILGLSASSVSAQMGPAGPPGGGGGSGGNGTINVYAGSTPSTNVPSGTSLTFTFTPTPGNPNAWQISYVVYKDVALNVTLPTISGTTCIVQPAQSGTLDISAVAYNWAGVPVDSSGSSVSVTWEAPRRIYFPSYDGPEPTSLQIRVTDRFGREVGPGCAYQFRSFVKWLGTPGFGDEIGGIGETFPTLYGPGALALNSFAIPALFKFDLINGDEPEHELAYDYWFAYPKFDGTTGGNGINASSAVFTYTAGDSTFHIRNK